MSQVSEGSWAITNHNANASTYIEHNANYEYIYVFLSEKGISEISFEPIIKSDLMNMCTTKKG